VETANFDGEQLDILSEIGNMTVGQAATSLGNFMNKLVNITIPDTKVYTYGELKKEFQESIIATQIDYVDGFVGSNLLMINEQDAMKFSHYITKEKLGIDEPFEGWNDLSKSALAEIFNIMVGNMSSGMSNIFNRHVTIDVPHLYLDMNDYKNPFTDDEILVAIWFDIRVEGDFSIRIVNIVSTSQAETMLKIIKGEETDEEDES